MKSLIHSVIAGIALVGSTSFSQAQVLNGSFSSGDFTSWTTLGGTEVLASGNPTTPGGVNQALIQSTDPSEGLASVSVATIDSTLGVTLPTTAGPDSDGNFTGTHPVVNGQAIYQTFTLGSAADLTFAFSFQSNDAATFDSTGYVLDGVYTQLAAQTLTFDQEVLNGLNTTPTTYVTVAPIALSAGSHTLAFVAYNTGDDTESSSLFITDVATEAVPEPGAWSLALVVGVAFVACRKLHAKFARI
jgi:hypothetical protein